MLRRANPEAKKQRSRGGIGPEKSLAFIGSAAAGDAESVPNAPRGASR